MLTSLCLVAYCRSWLGVCPDSSSQTNKNEDLKSNIISTNQWRLMKISRGGFSENFSPPPLEKSLFPWIFNDFKFGHQGWEKKISKEGHSYRFTSRGVDLPPNPPTISRHCNLSLKKK